MLSWDSLKTWFLRFLTLIIAICMVIFTSIYLISMATLVSRKKNFSKDGFAYFLALIVTIAGVAGYFVLHVVPRKAYRLLYALTVLFLLAGFLIGHALGLAGPTVNDCQRLGEFNIENVTETVGKIGDVIWVKSNSTDSGAIGIGSLGQELSYCGNHLTIFVSSFFLLILFFIGILDVQRVLLIRVKSKTYGERFVEMGISN